MGQDCGADGQDGDYGGNRRDRPDLMLVDLRLPDNRGLEVLWAASAHEACAQVQRFMITSSLYDQDVAQSYQFGASAVLSKPLSRAKPARGARPDQKSVA
jgi:CheY-like chemotaxis protein